MRKTIAILTVLLLVIFMVGCENSVNPAAPVVQSENFAKVAVIPFGAEDCTVNPNNGQNLLKPSGTPNEWYVPTDYATIQLAIDNTAVIDGDIINVEVGEHDGAFVTKQVHIVGSKETTINNGPLHPAGLVMGFRFLEGSDGSSISNLDFDFNVDLAIMNGASVNNVNIHHNTFENSLQAISNWNGSRWNIHHNIITDLKTWNGGGIGILVAGSTGEIVENNQIHQNIIKGTLHVWSGDDGGYAGSGIVLFADYRYGRIGSEAIKKNKVKNNTVSLVSDNSGLVDVVGFEMTDTRDNESLIVIYNNKISKNDFSETENSIVFTPSNLGDYNTISKNEVN